MPAIPEVGRQRPESCANFKSGLVYTVSSMLAREQRPLSHYPSPNPKKNNKMKIENKRQKYPNKARHNPIYLCFQYNLSF